MITKSTEEYIDEFLKKYTEREVRGIKYIPHTKIITVTPAGFNKSYVIQRLINIFDTGRITEVHRQEVYEALNEFLNIYPIKIIKSSSRKINIDNYEIILKYDHYSYSGQIGIYIKFNEDSLTPLVQKLIEKYKTDTFSLGYIPKFCKEFNGLYIKSIIHNDWCHFSEKDILKPGKVMKIWRNEKDKFRCVIAFPLLKAFKVNDTYKLNLDDKKIVISELKKYPKRSLTII